MVGKGAAPFIKHGFVGTVDPYFNWNAFGGMAECAQWQRLRIRAGRENDALNVRGGSVSERGVAAGMLGVLQVAGF